MHLLLKLRPLQTLILLFHTALLLFKFVYLNEKQRQRELHVPSDSPKCPQPLCYLHQDFNPGPHVAGMDHQP